MTAFPPFGKSPSFLRNLLLGRIFFGCFAAGFRRVIRALFRFLSPAVAVFPVPEIFFVAGERRLDGFPGRLERIDETAFQLFCIERTFDHQFKFLVLDGDLIVLGELSDLRRKFERRGEVPEKESEKDAHEKRNSKYYS